MALAQEMAAATGLDVHRGRKSVELLPPIHVDKGTVIRKWAAPLRSVCYLGDDLGDLAAFRALDQLATRGISAARIAVRSDEVLAELLQAADLSSTHLRARPDCCALCCSRRRGARSLYHQPPP
jgi:trehalose 6-phosphate phosphatase